ncbi:MAG: hypothetical protein AB2556_26020, partial [Candidatus Thiodiazotropha sp.]
MTTQDCAIARFYPSIYSRVGNDLHALLLYPDMLRFDPSTASTSFQKQSFQKQKRDSTLGSHLSQS